MISHEGLFILRIGLWISLQNLHKKQDRFVLKKDKFVFKLGFLDSCHIFCTWSICVIYETKNSGTF